MSDQRNNYGFPDIGQHRDNDLGRFIQYSDGTAFVDYRRTPTKLERAHAIAAEVRARKFPAPRRITPTGDV